MRDFVIFIVANVIVAYFAFLCITINFLVDVISDRLKKSRRSCDKCSHCQGGKCDIVTWESIDNLNLHGKCGFFNKKD